jgi:protein O-mannosyl-transferase
MPNHKSNPNSISTIEFAAGISFRRSLLLPGGVALLVFSSFLAYWPALNGMFILDDDTYLTNNRLIVAPDGLYQFWLTTEALDYYPVSNSTLWLEWRVWGINPTGYHVTNLLLHIVVALLFWVILAKLSIPGAFLAALLFAVHPVNVESVAWIAQRKGLLALVFFLLSILCYLREEEHDRNGHGEPRGFASVGLWYWISLLAFSLAMLSKGSVAILPLVLLLIIWWRRQITLGDSLRTAPFFVVAVLLTTVHIFFQHRGLSEAIRSDSFAQRLAGAGAVVWFYLSKALLPNDLIFVYPKWQIQTGDWRWWLPLAAAVALTTVLVWQRSSWWGRPLLFAWAFFCFALVPVMGFSDVGFMKQSLVADHYQYIAVLGVVALVAASWKTWLDRTREEIKSSIFVCAVILVGALTFLSWQQSRLYESGTTLYGATLQKNPESWMIHNDLGVELAKTGHLEEATEHFHQALNLRPDYADAYNNLVRALLRAGRKQEAIEQLQQASRLMPEFAEANNYLGEILFQDGRTLEAIEQFEQAIQLTPDNAIIHNRLGTALMVVGQLPEAIKHFEKTLQINPNDLVAYNNLAWILATAPSDHIRDPGRAVALAKKAVELDPTVAFAYNTLGVACYRAGNWQDTIEWLDKSTKLSYGGNAVDWFFLAMAHEQLGHHDKARQCYERAAKLIDEHLPQSEELLRFRRETEKLLADKSSIKPKSHNSQ